jgi:hypothetical protein
MELMAADNVMIIYAGDGTKAADYNTAHAIVAGEAVNVTAPASKGCSVQFDCEISSTSPSITPSANGVYQLTTGQTVEFILNIHPEPGHHTDAHFYVGPAGVTSVAETVPAPGLNSSAHTVRVGGVGPLGGR